ncbi:glycosyl hydrolase family 61-domain-containing protein, partial [Tirmania nivea]
GQTAMYKLWSIAAWRDWQLGQDLPNPAYTSGSTINWNDAVDTFTFSLPSSRGAGEYLVRIEQIALHAIPAQFYVSCAQIKATILVGGRQCLHRDSLPSGYSATDPGINFNIYYHL